MIVYERRASAILYRVLRGRADRRPFLLPANVCPVVPATFREAGQPFELVDIDLHSLAIDRDETLRRVRAGNRGGVVFIRPYGSEADPTPFFAELKAAAPDLLVIDDKCLCRPDCDGESISPLADVTLFSSGRAKYADVGGGGFAHLIDAGPYDRSSVDAAAWLELGPPERAWDEQRRIVIDAAEAADRQKETLNAIYTRGLPREIQFAPELQRWRFNIRVAAPEKLIESIFAAGLFASRHYPPFEGGYPAAARVHGSIVNLFNDRYFDEARAHRAVDVVLRHLDELA
jgi:hypothetical protein